MDPWVTLYHWDLPQELEDKGGWPERDTAYRFADYAMLVFDRLQDRVRTWTTLNEPWCSAMLGYYEGRQAPGRQNFADAMDAVHHLLLGHGLAAQRMRAAATAPIELGITLNMGTAMAATESLADQEAARRADGLGARIYLDPLLRGQYPGDILDDLSTRGVKLPVVDGDLAIIAEPIDVLGVNYYSSHRFSGVDATGRTEDEDGNPISVNVPLGRPVTAMDWEIVPEGFTELLVRLSREYPGVPMVITENGAAFDDEADPSGYVRDDDRTEYLSSHLAAVAAARAAGRRRARVLRVVADGQLRVVLRLREAVRPRARGLRDAGPHPEAERALVPRHDPQGARALRPVGWPSDVDGHLRSSASCTACRGRWISPTPVTSHSTGSGSSTTTRLLDTMRTCSDASRSASSRSATTVG